MKGIHLYLHIRSLIPHLRLREIHWQGVGTVAEAEGVFWVMVLDPFFEDFLGGA